MRDLTNRIITDSGLGYSTWEGAHPSIQLNVLDELSLDRWLLALKRRLNIIKRGTPLVADDSNEMGNKYTVCTWGMCGEEIEAWPEPQDHIWPIQFQKEARSAPLERPKGHLCPIDTRTPMPETEKLPISMMQGCFYTCRIFQRKQKTPTREEAIALYEKRIEEVKALIARKK